MDFKAVHNYAVSLRSGFDNYSSQYNIYPPFVTLAYLPLSFFPANIAYQIFCIILLCFLFSLVYALLSEKGNLIIPCENRITCKTILSLLIVYILFQTYPVNFAFERGNYDIIAASFAVFSLLAMTKKSVIVSAGWLAISTQLKIYPAILIIMLFARFGWKSVWYFALFNVLLLFTLGIPGFEKFVSTMSAFAVKPMLWPGNHSLFSFYRALKQEYFSEMSIMLYQSIFAFLSLIAFAILLYVFVFRYLRSTKLLRANIIGTSGITYFSGMEIGIIGTCFCIMSLIPTTSHDYNLVVQIIPLILLFSRSRTELFCSKKAAYIVTMLISVSVAYLFIPRFSILPFHLLGINSSLTEMKTPALLIAFFGYLYLALVGNADLNFKIEPESRISKI
jgi:hypothetical protein